VRPERLLGMHKPPPELPRLEPGSGRSRTGRADILVLPVIPWSYRRQRPQQLSEALARLDRRVFYGSLRGTDEPPEPVGVAPGVTLLPIPGVRREDPAERRLGGRALSRAMSGLARARGRFELRDCAQLVQSPFWGPLAVTLRERFGWRIVYDCLDAHPEFPTNRAQVLADAERRLAASADMVVATSELLRRQMEGWNAAARLLPNACDFALFADLPAASSPAGSLTVGYVGAVDSWFDLDLLTRLADLEPRWRFEIVGGIEDVASRIPRRPNITFHGERAHREMPDFHRRFDVEIIPFRLSALTHATDPVKLYEAAAAGRPVVATPMRSLETFARQGLVRLASTPEGFAREIASAAREGADGARRQRAFARENTWDIRAEALATWLAELATGPRREAARE
jgi:glycosyltransferase involved in cell wall biosynthesis